MVVHNFAGTLWLPFMVHLTLFPMKNILWFFSVPSEVHTNCPVPSVDSVIIIISSSSSSSNRWMSLVTGHFFPVLLLNQRWSPPLTLQASHCITFRIMCDVPSIAVFCSEYIECFPGTVSKFFFKLLVTIPVAPIITGTIVHFRFHIRCISIHKPLYFNFFSASFCTTFLSAGIAISIKVHVFSFLFIIITSGLFAVTSLSMCTAWFHNTVTSHSPYTGFDMCLPFVCGFNA